MTYRFLSPAQQDLADAVAYYENAVAGLGRDFIDEIERTIGRILQHPEAWTRISKNHRRCRTRRFPFGIIYSLEENVIVIAAVMNLRKKPESWRSRIK